MTRGQIRAQREAHDWLAATEGRQMVLDRTRNGEEVVEFMVAVLRGARFRWPQRHPKEADLPARPSSQQRVAAAQWLAERIWGRPAVFESAQAPAALGGDAAPPLSDAEAEAFRAWWIEQQNTALAAGTASEDAGSGADDDH